MHGPLSNVDSLFEKFFIEYESGFEREYGYLRPVIQTFGDRINYHAYMDVLISNRQP